MNQRNPMGTCMTILLHICNLFIAISAFGMLTTIRWNHHMQLITLLWIGVILLLGIARTAIQQLQITFARKRLLSGSLLY